MKIYVAVHDYHYNGQVILGVYDSFDRAKKELDYYTQQCFRMGTDKVYSSMAAFNKAEKGQQLEILEFDLNQSLKEIYE